MEKAGKSAALGPLDENMEEDDEELDEVGTMLNHLLNSAMHSPCLLSCALFSVPLCSGLVCRQSGTGAGGSKVPPPSTSFTYHAGLLHPPSLVLLCVDAAVLVCCGCELCHALLLRPSRT